MYCCGAVLMLLKLSTIKCHIQRGHKDSFAFAKSRKTFLIQKFERERERQKSLMVKALIPDQAVAVAPYKLAFTLGKYKMPFNKCDAMVEFAQSADSQSKVFSQMASSRNTITTKTVELHEKVLKPELRQLVEQSLLVINGR